MPRRRTTIELDDELLSRAQRALGEATIRATVEEALRRAADAITDLDAERRARQQRYLDCLDARVDLDVLASEEMWR
jgi:Arc/MetJ family transcription regulator